ncbi:MAG: hypothetical protein GW904_03605 [Candidatus Altiarchaeum hamiconexum]|uniref:TraB family protein n=2 Tax=Candidatus Altarchaeum hamiconexum TaxID=1803513 RepID=A0A8J7YQQ1_9ARCH|nr:hypothetical protein [Candidatus Altarchaeum hamiconexum]NCN68814.1 hypothetical protein [Candidatus Altarchaeum hamiconexum]NCT00421.1 hypothetical protein [Candidatus Altarchaeum hamiconexum]OIQ05387.1 MAG: hypothetical protein AUK59_04050 [Candidatus Altarchaeum sp. CG2_30_32_3053]
MIKITGTGHVLQKSVREVRETILTVKPDFVAVELDRKRYEILEENNFDVHFEQEHYSARDLFSDPSNIIPYLLAMLQREIGKKLNVFPGAEMREAILCAKETNADIILIDRDINITMNRLLNLPLNEKIRMLTLSPKMGLDIDFEDGINGLIDPKNLNKITGIMKKLPKFYQGMVEERDIYMARNLYNLQLNFPYANIIAVVGAGHKEGIEKFLKEFENKGKTDLNIDKINKINKINKTEKISLSLHFTNILFAFILVLALIFLKLKFR